MIEGLDCTGVSVVFLCHDGDGNFLMAKRSHRCRDEHGRWDPGAGALKFDEPVEGALFREVFEEYGVLPLEFSALGFRDVHRKHDGLKTHWIALDYLVCVNRNEVVNAEPHKHDEIKWFKMNSFPDNTHSQWPIFLDKYKRKIEDRCG